MYLALHLLLHFGFSLWFRVDFDVPIIGWLEGKVFLRMFGDVFLVIPFVSLFLLCIYFVSSLLPHYIYFDLKNIK